MPGIISDFVVELKQLFKLLLSILTVLFINSLRKPLVKHASRGATWQALRECKPARKAIVFVGLVNAVLEHDREELVVAEPVAAVVDRRQLFHKAGPKHFQERLRHNENAVAALAASELAALLTHPRAEIAGLSVLQLRI